MAVAITRNPPLAVPIEPSLLDAYDSGQAARNQVHEPIGRPDPDVTLRPAGTRAGTAVLIFEGRAAAEYARTALSGVGVFTLADDDVPENSMDFVVVNEVRTTYTKAGIKWSVTIGFREVIV